MRGRYPALRRRLPPSPPEMWGERRRPEAASIAGAAPGRGPVLSSSQRRVATSVDEMDRDLSKRGALDDSVHRLRSFLLASVLLLHRLLEQSVLLRPRALVRGVDEHLLHEDGNHDCHHRKHGGHVPAAVGDARLVVVVVVRAPLVGLVEVVR
eukprot:3432139-Pyramimonas_sp.AAC.1